MELFSEVHSGTQVVFRFIDESDKTVSKNLNSVKKVDSSRKICPAYFVF